MGAFRASMAMIAVVIALAVAALVGLRTYPPSAASAPRPVGSARAAVPTRVSWLGGHPYLSGVNVAWYAWSCDFGCGAERGVSSAAT
jgi:hypothetical protein